MYKDMYLRPIHNKDTETLWYVFYTEHFIELFQTRTEPFRTKQVFIDHFNRKRANFIPIYFFSY